MCEQHSPVSISRDLQSTEAEPKSLVTTDVEEITQKTGSFKRFPIFVRMLRSAVTQESESVFVDLLSYTDLEALKNK